MAISYNVYANDGQGGDVDYANPIAITSNVAFTTAALASPSDHTFAVRAFDTVSGIEDANTDARVRVVIDASGNDVTARPNAVNGLSASPTSGGTSWVSWGYSTTGQGGAPALFKVSLSLASSPIAAIAAATVPYLPGVSGYGCSLSGLSPQTAYSIAVQAVGGSPPLISPPVAVSIRYQASPLSGVDSLVGTASA